MSGKKNDYCYCPQSEPCVFRDGQTKLCLILTDTTAKKCNFRKTKEEFLDGVKKYPSSDADFNRYVGHLVVRCEKK